MRRFYCFLVSLVLVLFSGCSSSNSGISASAGSSADPDFGKSVYGYSTALSASLVFEEKSGVDAIDLFDRSQIFSGSETTFADIYQSAEAHFLIVKNDLEAAWDIHGDLLHAVYLMNVVHWLWPIGAPDQPIAKVPVGCVFHNATLTALDGPKNSDSGFYTLQEVTPQRYMGSPMACCSDFGMMLYIMLNMAGYESILVGRPGHIYVQAEINGDKYVLDSMLNYFASMDNVQLLKQDQTEPTTLTMFPFSATQKIKPSYFRHRFGTLRANYLMFSGRSFISDPLVYDVINHYDDWIANNKVLPGGY